MDKSTAENGYTLSMKKLLLLFVPLLLLVGCQNSDPKDGVIVNAIRECTFVERNRVIDHRIDIYGEHCFDWGNLSDNWIEVRDVIKLTILTPQGETYVIEVDRWSLRGAIHASTNLENRKPIALYESASEIGIKLIGKTWPPPIEDQNEKDEGKDEE